MRPRFVGRLGIADAVTAGNAALGFVAVAVAPVDATLSARLILLAAIADGLDGLLARRYGGTPVGAHLDSLADVASFVVAPAFVVVTLVTDGWGLAGMRGRVALVVAALFVTAGVLRLGMYTAYDTDDAHTEGVPTTLAATLLAAGLLAGVTDPTVAVVVTALLAVSMVATVTYPDLYPRDALAMGAIQALAVLAPFAFSRAFPRLLLAWALAYLALAPRFYWRSEGKRS